jgi:hypothetical protein
MKGAGEGAAGKRLDLSRAAAACPLLRPSRKGEANDVSAATMPIFGRLRRAGVALQGGSLRRAFVEVGQPDHQFAGQPKQLAFGPG